MSSRLLSEQAQVFAAVFLHVILAGVFAIVIDAVFPKFDESRPMPVIVFEIALQISLGALIISRLSLLSRFFLSDKLIASAPFGVV